MYTILHNISFRISSPKFGWLAIIAKADIFYFIFICCVKSEYLVAKGAFVIVLLLNISLLTIHIHVDKHSLRVLVQSDLTCRLIGQYFGLCCIQTVVCDIIFYDILLQ